MILRLLVLYLLTIPVVSAHTVTVTLQEFDSALQQTERDGDFARQLLLQKLQEELLALNLDWQDGQVIRQFTIDDQELDGGCGYSADLRDFVGEFVIDDSSSINLSLTSLNEPLEVGVSLSIHLNADARILQSYGVDIFGKCRKYASDDVDLEIDGWIELVVTVSIDPQYSVVNNGLKLQPIINVVTHLDSFTHDFDVKGSPLDKQLEKRIDKAVDKAISADRLQALGNGLRERLQENLIKSWGGDSIVLSLPELNPKQQQQLLALLDIPIFTELGEILVRNHLPELLFVLITGDTGIATEFVSDVAICELLVGQMQPLSRNPLYTQTDKACVVAEYSTSDDLVFADSSCTLPINFRTQSDAEFCEEILNTSKLGNAALNPEAENVWEPSPGATLKLGILELAERNQPYMHRETFHTVETANGTCELEMRIFKADVSETDLKPLIWWHGGSWTYRRDGVLGLESQVSHFTDRGFIVFEPFYRLTGKHEGNIECNRATGNELLDDANAALSWVNKNAFSYGASNQRPAVVGQSAGAHLAAWLSVHRAEEIRKALLLYPPTDFAHFIRQYQAGEVYADSQGLRALSRFIGVSVDQVDPDDAFIVQNSFPTIIAKNPDAYPPFFIVHGSGDSIVPFDQATRLCAAFNGDQNGFAESPLFESGRYVEACGDQGELHLIEGAEHALDVCLFDVWCAAGNGQAQNAMRDTLSKAIFWLE